MRFVRYVVGFSIGVFFFSGAFFASANTTGESDDPVYAEQFSFYCGPYTRSFEADKHYIVNTSTCFYSVPHTLVGNKMLTLYKGTPGVAAAFVGGDAVFHGGTLISHTPNTFSGAQNGDDFFAVIYDFALDQTATPLNAYLQGATSTLPAGVVENQNFYIIPWKWGPKPVEEFDPVVVIPGILGSWEKDGEWALDPITHTYDNLVDTLLANGYVEDETLFTLPYDWHTSSVITAELLGAKISSVRDICDCDQVDIVAHSMGGNVASQYVVSESYNNDIDQIFYLGTPMGGAPLAYKAWESGEIEFGDHIQNIVMQRIFKKEARDAGFNNIFEYIRSGLVPSVQELLPIYGYLKTASGPLSYPTGYPQNLFLENLSGNFGKLFSGAQLFTVVGHTGTASTTRGFVVTPSTKPSLWEHGEIVRTEFGAGDGTVPHTSSLFFIGPEKELSGITHGELASTSVTYVFEMLNGKKPATLVGNFYDYRDYDYAVLINKLAPSSGDFRFFAETVGSLLLHQHPLMHKVLTLVLYSPIDVEVTSPDGKRIGRDLATGVVLNEIPGALYSGLQAEPEFVIIPDPLPGEYQVRTIGTGEGGYTIATGYSDSATTTESFVSGTAVADQVTEHALFISPTTTTIIIEKITPPEVITPASCAVDMQAAYTNNWITKRQIYKALLADCKLLGVLFVTRDKAKTNFIRKGVTLTIKLTLDHMDRLAKDKSNKPEAVELITKNTAWFRQHEL